MSGDALQSADGGSDARRPSPRARRTSTGVLATSVGILGGFATTVGVTGWLAHFGAALAPEIAVLPIGAVDEATPSLTPGWAKTLANEAKRCKAPLSFVTLVALGAERPATIRIRSGTYVSQWFSVTESPLRVALPFPAPYVSGRGTLVAEGRGENLLISIEPGWRIDHLDGALSRDVTWRPGNACL